MGVSCGVGMLNDGAMQRFIQMVDALTMKNGLADQLECLLALRMIIDRDGDPCGGDEKNRKKKIVATPLLKIAEFLDLGENKEKRTARDIRSYVSNRCLNDGCIVCSTAALTAWVYQARGDNHDAPEKKHIDQRRADTKSSIRRSSRSKKRYNKYRNNA